MTTTVDRYVTAEELARRLSVDRRTVYRMYKRGEIPGLRVGRVLRFNPVVVEGWLRGKTWTQQDRDEVIAMMRRRAEELGLTDEDVSNAITKRRRRRRSGS